MPQKKTNKITLLLLVLLGAFFLSCDGDAVEKKKGPYEGPWEVYEIEGLEENSDISGIYMFSSELGWGCANEAIIKFQGGSWTVALNLEGKYDRGCMLKRIRFSSPTNGWVAGWEWQARGSDTAIAYRYDGTSWRDISPKGVPGFFDIFPLSPSDVWACGYDGIYHYDGSNWVRSVEVSHAQGLWFTSPTHGWCVTAYGEYIRWDGSSWRGVQSWADEEHRFAVCAPTPETGWAAGGGFPAGVPGFDAQLFYFDAAWDGWKPYRESSFNYDKVFYDVHFANPDDGWAVGQGTYRYNGQKWVRVPPPPSTAYSVFTLGGDDVWVGLFNRRICKYNPPAPTTGP